MNEVCLTERLEVVSLGRMAFIGELYDARMDSFSSHSLLKASVPANWIQCTDMARMDYDYKITDTISDRFDLLQVQGELQVAVILGLVKLSGSASYLSEEKKSSKCVSCSLISRLQTVNEKLIASFEDLVPHLDLAALNDPKFTHVVVEINWGANCLLSLESSSSSESNGEEIRGKLESVLGGLSVLKKALSVQGLADLKKVNENLDSINGVTVKVNADLIPKEEWPTTVVGFLKFLKEVPKLVKDVNNGKGKPLSYGLIPLSGLRRLAKLDSAIEVQVKKMDESFLSSLIMLFEDLAALKQKFHEVYTLMAENSKFLPKAKLKKVAEMRADFLKKETELKCLLREEWVPLKSGEKSLKDVIRLVENFKSRSLRLTDQEDFLESLSWVTSRLSAVKSYTAEGVRYLGEGETFDDLQRQSPKSEFVVLVTSEELEKADPEGHRKNSNLFVMLAAERLPNTVYVVLDLDLGPKGFLNKKIDRVRCFHVVGNKTLSGDMLADYMVESESNFARVKNRADVEWVKHKPGNRVTVQMPCPGFKSGTCPSTLVEWSCVACKGNLEYAFDDRFYCMCGRTPSTSYEYRCHSVNHKEFTSPKPEFLRQVLSELRPLKEMNILVIGQSGVGKSTWINGIVNYLTYDSLEEAEAGGAIVVIPAKFRLFTQDIEVGDPSENEETSTGSSATQFSRTYTFPWEDRCVRLIDTPGLGDNRGIEQDRENVRNLVQHISHLKELHGVCILLKSNDNRLNPLFCYCVKELLVHLHKSVVRNIVFCFTNARASLYCPGSASVILDKLLRDLPEQRLALGENNKFCLDNEAFLFLCALEKGVKFDGKEDLVQSLRKSWEMSLKETRRLMYTIRSFEPHDLEETMSLVTARFRVLSLTKPLAEAKKTILMNIETCKRQEEELKKKGLVLNDLEKKLYINEVKLVNEPLKYPRTVCTSAKCVSYVALPNSDVQEILYKTHCHQKCYLKDVTPKTVNNHALKHCQAIEKDGTCTTCGCSWISHMHLTYSQKRVENRVVDKNTQSILESEMSEKQKLEEFVKILQDRIGKYKAEESFIVHATAKFGMFLKQNAITVYNDAFEEYLLHLIDVEENKPHKSNNEKSLLKSLKDSLEAYREEVRVLTEAVEKGIPLGKVLTTEEVIKLEKELYALELMGPTIKESVDLGRFSMKKSAAYIEHSVCFRTPQVAPKEQSILTKAKNSLINSAKNLFS